MRSPKRLASYRRRGPVREPYEVVLIVCEGTKTEPNYFNRFRAVYGLSNANVRIMPGPGSDPMSIVIFAIAEIEREEDYDRVYCVFDRDRHTNFDDAIRRIDDYVRGTDRRLIAITSVPCFEVWVLLHFQYTTASFVPAAGSSGCTMVLREVQRYFPSYSKGHKTAFDELMPKMEDAMRNADLLYKHNSRTMSVNPATSVHELVQYLRQLKT
jgi:hypothetical protein